MKKAEHWRIDAFELWCYKRLLRVPWTARRSNQSILMEISPGCSLERLVLKLKLRYFANLMLRAYLFEKNPGAGKDWGQEEKGTTEDEIVGWHHRLNGHEIWIDSGSWWWTGRPGMLLVHGVTKSWTRLRDWTELSWTESLDFLTLAPFITLMRRRMYKFSRKKLLVSPCFI